MFQSIIQNYSFLKKTFEQDLEDSPNMPFAMKCRLNGMISTMDKFENYFGFKLGYFILRHTDNLARALQDPNLNAAQGRYDL